MRRGGAALAVAIMLWCLTACGGDDQTTGVATLGGGGTASTDEQAGSAEEKDPEEQALEFAQCMRDNGVDMPDPQVEGGRMLFGGGGPGADVDPEVHEQALEACEDERPRGGGEFSPEDQAEMQDRMLAMAECMRENGYDMPDPDVSGGGGGFMIGPESGIDLDDPEFQSAMEACRDEVGMPAPQGSRDQGTEG